MKNDKPNDLASCLLQDMEQRHSLCGDYDAHIIANSKQRLLEKGFSAQDVDHLFDS